ncbi:MAG: AMP-binding protein [Pseudomonadota bacterium]
MHPRQIAQDRPDAPALSMLDASGGVTAQMSYGEMEGRANRYAHALRALGLSRGDRFAIWKKNSLSFIPIYWAAQRSGLVICPVATHLSADEADYIIGDSGSRLLITDGRIGQAPAVLERLDAEDRLAGRVFWSDDALDGAEDFDAFAADFPDTPIADESAGYHMLYSSGTTGRPKGVKVTLPDDAVEAASGFVPLSAALFGFSPDTRYLSPAPLYHAAPLVYCLTVQRLGGHVFVMDRFAEEPFLAAIERNAITHTQVVPTMFVRLLKQPEELRRAYDLSSLELVLHAAAPCPVHVKRAVIDWLGPVVSEFYGGSEGNGLTYLTAAEWLNNPGSVGRAIFGTVRICDPDTGAVLGPDETGTVYFEGKSTFEYHGDAEKTKGAYHSVHAGWSTLGDVGHMNAAGYLFLTDRKANMIISGGVNIYPQETENILLAHPSVLDAAVLGVPCEEMGERVKAFVQTVPGAKTDGLDGELIAFARDRISHVKAPREVEFVDTLPRTESGKLLKRMLLEAR